MVITTNFLTQTRSDIKDFIVSTFTYGAVGSASTTPAASDVTLGDEFFRDAIDISDDSVINAVTSTLILQTTEANGNIIREFGWFSPATAQAGTAWIRDTMTPLNKTSDVQLYLDSTITVSVTEV